MSSIFVSVANYRDPEIGSTVRSLLCNISDQHDVRIVILTQGDAVSFPRWMPVEQIVIPASASQGACWARHFIQTHYHHEDYHLQIDSHTQFAPNWDLLMMADHAEGGPQSIITTYLAGYEFHKPDIDPPPADAFRHDGERFTRWPRPSAFQVHDRDGIPSAVPYYVDPDRPLTEALYYSGHWAFTAGQFILDVPYDPALFFHGEEITMAIRAYCAGYTLYTPRKWVGSTLHARTTNDNVPRRMFWDGPEDAGRGIDWWKRDVMSKIVGQAICNGKWWGQFGIRDQSRYDEFCVKMRDSHNVDLPSIVYK